MMDSKENKTYIYIYIYKNLFMAQEVGIVSQSLT